MKCPKCGCEWSTVLDTRAKETYVKRRRQCVNEECRSRWSTCEVMIPEETRGRAGLREAVEAWEDVMQKEGARE